MKSEEIRQIVKDLSINRKRRKAANASKESRPTANVEKENNHRIVKVVHLVDSNNSKGPGTHNKQNDEAQAPSLPAVGTQSETSPFQPELNAENPSNADIASMTAPDHIFSCVTGAHRASDVDCAASNIDHNRDRCTVCQRFDRLRRIDALDVVDNPLARTDDVANVDGGSADQTVRPSADPQEQLRSVLGQLKDEYHHLKMLVTPQN